MRGARTGRRPRVSEVAPLVLLAVVFVLGCSSREGPDQARDSSDRGPEASPSPDAAMALHDHTPRHGGVVGMSGTRHLEARAAASGRIEIWLTDFWRTPLPLERVRGRVTLGAGSGATTLGTTLELTARDGALTADAGPFPQTSLDARFEIELPGEPLLIEFRLPVGGDGPGAGGAPLAGCRERSGRRARPGGRSPRCAVEFPGGISALAVGPASERFFVAALDAGVTVWALPGIELLFGLPAPPPIRVPTDAVRAPHPEVANALALSPNGREIVVAVENRLLRHATTDGRLLAELARAPGAVRSLAWSPDGENLLVTTFYGASAWLLSADDGHEIRSFAVGGEAGVAAIDRRGDLVAVSSESGGIVVFWRQDGRVLRRIETVDGPPAALSFVDGAERRILVGGGRAGVVSVWNADDGALLASTTPGRPILALAPAPSGERVAVGGYDGDLRLIDPATGAAESLAWHGPSVAALAWRGGTLLSGDIEGRLAAWHLGGNRSRGD